MTSSLVSVVIPTYNRAYCIQRTVDSALQQTHPNVEVLVVDDGSTDGSAELLDRVYGRDPRVRVIQKQNGGVSSARNTGLRAVRGDFVALLDSDDIWLPWKLEAQLRCLEHYPDAGMIWTDMDAIGPDGEVVARRYLKTMYGAYAWFEERELFERRCRLSDIDARLAAVVGDVAVASGDIFSEMVLGNLVHTSSVLLRRERAERVGGFSLELRHTGEDYDFHLRTCREGPVAYLDAVSILYQCGRSDQLTSPKLGVHMARNFLRTILPVLERDRDRIRLPRVVIDEVLADAHAWLGVCLSERGERLEAARAFATSLRHKPAQPRVAGHLALSLLPPRLSSWVRRFYRRGKSPFTGEAP